MEKSKNTSDSAPAAQPLVALRALGRLTQDPNDTALAFEVVRHFDPSHLWRLRDQLAERSPELLSERPDLLAKLRDRDALCAMPEGSLGRAYVEFCDREGITPGGLIEASESIERETLDEELLWVADRLRDQHDLWHVVAGYHTDLIGELSLLAFTTAQTGNRGVGLLVAGGYVQSLFAPLHGQADGKVARAETRRGFHRGRKAEWLPGVRWEDWLARPLSELREHLAVGAPPKYTPVYFDEVAA